MSLIGWLIDVVYRSLFIASDSGYRRAHLLSKAVFILSIILLIALNPRRTYLLIFLISPISLLYPGPEWLLAVTTLSSLVGVTLAGSAFLLSLLGLFEMTILQFIEIIARTIGISLGVVFSFTIISPIEIYNIIYTLHGGRLSVIPLLLWRMIPQGMRYFVESIQVGRLKQERVTKRIPPAVAGMIEISTLIEEYSYWRLRTTPKGTIGYERSYKYTIVLLIIALLISLVQAKAP